MTARRLGLTALGYACGMALAFWLAREHNGPDLALVAIWIVANVGAGFSIGRPLALALVVFPLGLTALSPTGDYSLVAALVSAGVVSVGLIALGIVSRRIATRTRSVRTGSRRA